MTDPAAVTEAVVAADEAVLVTGSVHQLARNARAVWQLCDMLPAVAVVTVRLPPVTLRDYRAGLSPW